ncbi:aldehyde dehydrogenase family protein [Nocardia gipuzkoensis]|uniref:aldehyde dehydrogenase family protein n=1 Tax=Nocardia gipuzkoensis TaxID=2749991 RepID=UPI00237DDE8C|nr:aldehyde dehydrogenase family protein [Nocardia gipuzkoensis]MDE1674986.1 aldehyde dehydrogenase family protein [Nocardia gipuzkoensis]
MEVDGTIPKLRYNAALALTDSGRAAQLAPGIFGPVATFEIFDTELDAIERANATQYGLAASIWTRDVDRLMRVGRRIDAGTVWTNTWASSTTRWRKAASSTAVSAGSTATARSRSSKRSSTLSTRATENRSSEDQCSIQITTW